MAQRLLLILLSLLWVASTLAQAPGLHGQGKTKDGLAGLPRPYQLTEREHAYLENLATLRVPLITGQPPLTFLQGDTPAGYLNELLEYVAAALGLELERIPGVSYAESIALLEQQQADLLNDYSVNSLPGSQLQTTIPVLSVPFVAVGRAGSRPVRNVSDLEGRRIVMVSGFQQTRVLQQRYPELELLLVDHIAAAYRSLRSRDADVYIDNATHAGYRLSESMVSDLQIIGELPEQQLGRLQLHFAISQRHQPLHSAFEKVLATIPEDVLQEMRDRWLYTRLQKTEDELSLTAEEAAFLAAHPVIRVALDPNWAPIEYRDNEGRFSGMSLDYLAHLEKLLGIEFEIAQELPTWTAAVQAVRQKEADMFAAVSRTPERESFTHFTPPYLHLPIHIFARDEVSYIGTAENLKGRKVAVVAGYAIEEWLKRDFPQIDLVSVRSPEQGLEAVVDSEVHAFVGNLVTTTYYLRKLGIDNVGAVGDSGYSNSLSMAVRNDWPLLENILAKGLQRIARTEHELIFKRWMSIRFEHQVDYRLLWQIGLASLLLLALILYWNRRLSIEVGNRKLAENALLEHKTQLEQRVEDRTSELRAINQALLQEIGEREQVEEKLRVAAAVFASTAEGVAITDLEGTIIDVNQAFSVITGYSKEEALGRNPSILQSGRHDPSYYQAMWHSLEIHGQWRGEIWNRRRGGEIFPELLTISVVNDEHGKPQGYVAVFADISALKETEDRLEHLAHHDALTGLPNRLLLNARLEQAVYHAKRHRLRFALVFIDLDRFKRVNDTLGHQTGDALLVAIAGRLLAAVREEDTVARISGDEFVVLLENVDDEDRVLTIALKLMGVFKRSFELDDATLDITASMGISLFPGDSEDGEILLRNADAAMYRAKEEGRNTFEFFTHEMSTQALEHAFFESALRSAITHDQFRLVYQPQMDIETRQCLGFEALLRWEHPEQGNIPPSRFIPVAEQSGLIREIGQWVLEQACSQAKRWIDQGLEFGRLAVNMSGQQVMASNLLTVVEQALEKSGLPASMLELEVTESFAMRRDDQQITRLHRLREMGITLAIDDFGTGYSSLSYLKQLPVDKLKIDQSFVLDVPDDENDMAICETIIAMGRALGLEVIAEGVETEQQAAFLLNRHCHQAQGYLFSRPLEVQAVRDLLVGAAAQASSLR